MKFYLDCFEIFYPNNKRTTFPLQNGDYVLVHYETKEEGKPWTVEGENITVLCKYKITPGTTMGGEAEKLAVKWDKTGKITTPKIKGSFDMDNAGRTLGGAHATLFSEGSPWFIRKNKKKASSHEI